MGVIGYGFQGDKNENHVADRIKIMYYVIVQMDNNAIFVFKR